MFNNQSKGLKALNELLINLKINQLSNNDHFYLPLQCKFEEDCYSQFLTCQNNLLFENKWNSQGIINLFLSQKMQSSHNIAVIYGQPGSGKSFTMKKIEQFLWEQYDTQNEQYIQKFIPILINRLKISNESADLVSEILSTQYSLDSEQINELRKQIQLKTNQLVLLFDQCKMNVVEILKNCQQFWRDSKIIIMMEDSNDDKDEIRSKIDNQKCLKIQILQFQRKQVEQFIEMSYRQNIKSSIIKLMGIQQNYDKIDMLIDIISKIRKQNYESQWNGILLENQRDSLKQELKSYSSDNIESDLFDQLVNDVQKQLQQILTPIKYQHNIAKYQLEELTKSPKTLSILINTLNMMNYDKDQSIFDFYDSFIQKFLSLEFQTILKRQNQYDEASYIQAQLKIFKAIYLKTVFNYNSSAQVEAENQNDKTIKQSFLVENFIYQASVQDYLTLKFILECTQNLAELSETDFIQHYNDLTKFSEIQIFGKIQLQNKSNKYIVDILRQKLCSNSIKEYLVNIIQKSGLIENFEQIAGNLFFLLKKIQPIIKNQSFKNVKIKNTTLSNAQFVQCDFSGSQFTNVDISGAQFISCNLSNLDWQNTITPPINIVVESNIQTAKFLSNGKFIAMANNKNKVNIFNLKQGKLIQNFIITKHQITGISIEQNEEFMAISDQISQITLWSIHRRKLIRKKECNSNVSFVLLSKYGNFLAYGTGKKNSVKVLNVKAWLIRSIYQDSVSCAFTPNEKELVILTKIYQINSIQLITKRVVLKFDGELFYGYNKICFSPNGKYFLQYYGNLIGIWNWKTQQIIQTIKGSYSYSIQFLYDSQSFVQTLLSGFQVYQFEKDQFVLQYYSPEQKHSIQGLDCSPKSEVFILYSPSKQCNFLHIVDKKNLHHIQKTEDFEIEPLFKFSPDGTYFAFGGAQLKLFNTNTWTKVKLNNQSLGIIYHLAISSDGLFLAIAFKNYFVQIISVYESKVIAQFKNSNYSFSQVAFSGDGKTLAITTSNKIQFWDIRKKQFIDQKELEIYKGETCFFLGINDFFVSCWQNKFINIFNFQNHKQISKFIGHSKAMYGLTYCRKSMLLASGIQKKVKQWSIIKNKLIRQYESHTGFVSSLSFSPNGELLASGSEDKTIVLWNNSLGQNDNILIGHIQYVITVKFHQNEILASSGGDSLLILWDLKNGQQIQQVEKHNGNINSLVFSPVDQLLISGGEDKQLCYWDLSSFKKMKSIKNFTKQIQAISFSSDSQKIAICSIGSLENDISIWNILSKQLIQSFCTQKGSINAFTFSPNGQTLLFEMKEQIVFWEYMTGEKIAIELQKLGQSLYEIVFSRDGELFATRDNYNQIVLWNLEKRKQLQQLKVHQCQINSILFSPNDQQLVSSSNDVYVWDVNIYESKQIIRGQNNDCRLKILGFLRGGKIFVYNSLKSIDLKIYFCCIKTGECVKSLNKFGSCYIMSPDGNYLIYQNNQKQLVSQRIYQKKIIEKLENKSLLSQFFKQSLLLLDKEAYQEQNYGFQNEKERELKLKTHFSQLNQVAISSDGNLLALACKDDMISLWNATNGKFIQTIQKSQQQIQWNIIFSPDCQLLCYYYGRHVYSYNLQESKVSCLFQKYTGSFHYIIFSPKGSVIATLYSDLSDLIILWDITTNKPLLSIEGYNTQLRSLIFTNEGDCIVTGSIDQSIYFLDSNSGELVDQLDGMDYQSELLVFSSDGKYLLSKEITQKLYFWNVEQKVLLNRFEEPKFQITNLFFPTQQGFNILGIEKNELFVFNLQRNQKLEYCQSQNEIIDIVKQSRANKIAQISQQFSVLIWDITLGKLTKKIEPPKLDFVFTNSGDKKLIAFQFSETCIQVWDSQNQLHLYIFKEHSDKINVMVFSITNQYLVSGSSDNSVIIWDIVNGKLLKQLYGHQSSVCSLAFSGDNNTIASGSQDCTIRIYTVDNLNQSKVLEGHQGFVTSLSFSDDGFILASGSNDNSIILWNIKSLTQIRILEGHKSEILSLQFSADGLDLISESQDEKLISWMVETGDINFFSHLEQPIPLLNKNSNFINFDYSSLRNSNIYTPSNLDIIQIANRQKRLAQQKLF